MNLGDVFIEDLKLAGRVVIEDGSALKSVIVFDKSLGVTSLSRSGTRLDGDLVAR